MRRSAAVFFAIASVACSTSAHADELRVIVVGESSELAGAVTIARDAAHELKEPIVEPTLAQPAKMRTMTGWAVAIHGPERGAYVVTSFLGSVDEAYGELEFVQRRLPAARLIVVNLEPRALDHTYDAWRKYNVLVLGSFPEWEDALAFAKKIGKRTRTPFSMREMIWDDSRGLIYPENFLSEDCAGAYAGRRDNTCEDDMFQCVSIERSSVYVGMGTGLYLVIGGVFDDRDVPDQLERYQKAAPGAYILRTAVFPGCVH